MNPEDQACETPTEDHIACLVEYLRKPGARLNISGDTWTSANEGVTDANR